MSCSDLTSSTWIVIQVLFTGLTSPIVHYPYLIHNHSRSYLDDEDTQQDMFRNSDEEAENEDQENVEQETKWRMERFEREKFLAEQVHKVLRSMIFFVTKVHHAE